MTSMHHLCAPLALGFLLTFSGAGARLASAESLPELPAFFRVVGVAADDWLNIRAEPSARAELLGRLLPNARWVEVTAFSPTGSFARINLAEREGWVARRYLMREEAPPWWSGEQALECFGTEPFWLIRFFLPTHRAEFFTPENGGVELVLDTTVLPRTQYPTTLAIPFGGPNLGGASEGMAVVRAGECSDGMSDRAYALAALVYFRSHEMGLSGCCRLLTPLADQTDQTDQNE